MVVTNMELRRINVLYNVARTPAMPPIPASRDAISDPHQLFSIQLLFQTDMKPYDIRRVTSIDSGKKAVL